MTDKKNINQSHPLMFKNNLTKKKEHFMPLSKDGLIGMYVCGPTVYSRAHIGNLRSAVNFDVLNRLLIYTYGFKRINYVMNYTDIDDKIINASVEQKKSISEITNNSISLYEKDMADLAVLSPTHRPKVSEHIPEIINYIEILIDKKFAYVNDSGVYFNTENFNEYGILSNRKPEDQRDTGSNGKDFALWKFRPNDPDEHVWQTPWGQGRPGWHIECSAMSKKYLGDCFDIHGGGIDLLFPHHEAEISQSRCCTGTNGARFWLHNNFVTINGDKMAKSANNMLTLDKITDRFDPVFIRYMIIKNKYSKFIDWNELELERSKKELISFWKVLDTSFDPCFTISSDVISPLYNDMDTPGFIAKLHKLRKDKRSNDLANALNLMSLLPSKEIMENNPKKILTA